jgi:hypothetical protein
MLDELLHRMRGYSPHPLQTDKRYPEAAVLVPITRSDEPEVVLTLRASGLSTHSGEVAFPPPTVVRWRFPVGGVIRKMPT